MKAAPGKLKLPTARAAFGAIGLAGLFVVSVAIVLAAARGRTFLAPVLHKHPPGWLLWPFGGLWNGHKAVRQHLQFELLGALAAMLVCWGLATAYARFLRPAVVGGVVAAIYFVYFLGAPLLLTDVFNYVEYARMGVVHHLNPYVSLPIAIAGDPVYHLSNWHHLPSPYGPLFTLINYPLAPLGIPAEYWTYKALILVASLGSLWLVARIARQLGHDPRLAVVLVGLNPLVLVYGAGGQHNDMLLMLFVLGAVTLALDRRDGGSVFAIAGAVAMKASAAVFAPIVIAGAKNRRRALAGAALGALVFGGATLIAFGPHLPAISKQSKLVTVFSIPNMIGYAFGRGGEDVGIRHGMEALLALSTIACTIWAWRAREIVRPLAWETAAVIFTLGWDMPWYVLWLLPFLVFVRDRAFRIAGIAIVAWITLQWLPLQPHYAHLIGITPHATPMWGANKLYLNSLLK